MGSGQEYALFMTTSGEISLIEMSKMEKLGLHLSSLAEDADREFPTSEQIISPKDEESLPSGVDLHNCTVCGLPCEMPFMTSKYVELGHRPCMELVALQRVELTGHQEERTQERDASRHYQQPLVLQIAQCRSY